MKRALALLAALLPLLAGCGGGTLLRAPVGTMFPARGALPADGATGTAVLPTGTLRVAFAAPVRRITTTNSVEDRDPPEGGVFLGVSTVLAAVAAPHVAGTAQLAARATLVADGRRYRLPAPYAVAGGAPVQTPRRQWVALPRDPSSFALEVRVAGVQRTIDGRTGRVKRSDPH